MIVKLQTNLSDDRKMDKSITDVLSLTGYLKEGCSIIDPVILFEGSITSVCSCNYMTIPDFNRSYFIRNIETVRDNLFQVSAHVDVLSTYKNSIRGCQSVIRKQENNWNLYLDDGTFKVYSNPIVLTRAFPSGFSTQSFILAVAAGGA